MKEKREIIFDMLDDNYRVVCRWGYSHYIDFAWYGHLQKKVTYKKWIFFGETKTKWVEINKCWWSTNVETKHDLQKLAFSLYDENIALKKRITRTAMNL